MKTSQAARHREATFAALFGVNAAEQSVVKGLRSIVVIDDGQDVVDRRYVEARDGRGDQAELRFLTEHLNHLVGTLVEAACSHQRAKIGHVRPQPGPTVDRPDTALELDDR